MRLRHCKIYTVLFYKFIETTGAFMIELNVIRISEITEYKTSDFGKQGKVCFHFRKR